MGRRDLAVLVTAGAMFLSSVPTARAASNVINRDDALTVSVSSSRGTGCDVTISGANLMSNVDYFVNGLTMTSGSRGVAKQTYTGQDENRWRNLQFADLVFEYDPSGKQELEVFDLTYSNTCGVTRTTGGDADDVFALSITQATGGGCIQSISGQNLTSGRLYKYMPTNGVGFFAAFYADNRGTVPRSSKSGATPDGWNSQPTSHLNLVYSVSTPTSTDVTWPVQNLTYKNSCL